jgi:hypothetical protein
MIAHHSIGADIDSKALGKCEQALFYPVSPMLERPSTLKILATEKGSANTAGNTVVVGGVIQSDESFSGLGH